MPPYSTDTQQAYYGEMFDKGHPSANPPSASGDTSLPDDPKAALTFRTLETFTKDKQEVLDRGKEATAMLQNLAKTQRDIWEQTVKYRKDFYSLTTSILVFTVVGGGLLIVLAGFFSTNNSYVLMLSAFGTMLAAILKLPSIIASHLFPKNMSDSWVDLIKSTLEQDMEIRNYHKDSENKAEEAHEAMISPSTVSQHQTEPKKLRFRLK